MPSEENNNKALVTEIDIIVKFTFWDALKCRIARVNFDSDPLLTVREKEQIIDKLKK